jgi:hypothetical protein
MIGKVLPWFLYIGFLAVIVVTGWQEPLKYRFQAAGKVLVPQPSAQSSILPTSTPAWMSDTRRWDTVRPNFPYAAPSYTPAPYGGTSTDGGPVK